MKIKHTVEFVSYDGEYPTLCSGTLILRLDGKEIKFPDHCLISGGAVVFDDDYNDYIYQGPWSIGSWPKDWPESAKQDAEDLANANIPHGCCGGCVD